MSVSICIVNYNTVDMTLRAIQSVIRNEPINKIEIILIDNDSYLDEKKALMLGILDIDQEGNFLKTIFNDFNLGFGKANNQAMSVAKGDFIALLNSDTELKSNCFTRATDYLRLHPDVGAVGCRLITPDGLLDHGCKRGFPTPVASLLYFMRASKLFNRPDLDQYHLGHLDEYKSHNVDAISGAFMVIRKDVIDQVGMFDERFFMYGEDLDLCYRIKEAGWRIVYNPEIGNVIHYKGASSKKRKFKTLFNFYEAMFLFYNKHYIKKYNPLVTVLVYIAIIIQFIIKLVMNYCFSKKV